jgi:hypothetical protein
MRDSQWQRWRKSTPKSRIEADKAMIDAIREAFKMKPLYSDERERSPHVYIEVRGKGMRTRYELS